MPGRRFNKLPAGGPMAEQAEREYFSMRDAKSQEYQIELRALRNQLLPAEQYNKKAAILHGKHSLEALRTKRDWNQRMTMIQQYEELGAAGTISPERANMAQYKLSGYDVPEQKPLERPNYWAEHRNLIQERNRIQMEILDPWDRKKGKGPWRLVTGQYSSKSKKAGQPSNWGREATPLEVQQIEGVQEIMNQLDAYEFALLNKMDPEQRKVNQLSRAMSMRPQNRVAGTPGVGGRRPHLPLGDREPDGKERERFETPGYKMTQEKAMKQAKDQLKGGYANKERVIALAKQIFSSSQQPRSAE